MALSNSFRIVNNEHVLLHTYSFRQEFTSSVYGDFQDLVKRTALDKVLRIKTFKFESNPKYGGYQRGLASIVYKFFDKKSAGSGMKNEITQNQELAEELYKPIIRKFNKRKFIHHLKTIVGVLIQLIYN